MEIVLNRCTVSIKVPMKSGESFGVLGVSTNWSTKGLTNQFELLICSCFNLIIWGDLSYRTMYCTPYGPCRGNQKLCIHFDKQKKLINKLTVIPWIEFYNYNTVDYACMNECSSFYNISTDGHTLACRQRSSGVPWKMIRFPFIGLKINICTHICFFKGFFNTFMHVSVVCCGIFRMFHTSRMKSKKKFEKDWVEAKCFHINICD